MSEQFTVENLLSIDGFADGCGKKHFAGLKKACIGKGALYSLPYLIKEQGCKKPFILADSNTYNAAGKKVFKILQDAGFEVSEYVIPCKGNLIMPDEHTAGSIAMHFDKTCDIIIAVGSGVINDNGKLLAANTSRPYFIVATAPSMDGFVSATSSMDVDGLKQSLNTVSANVLIGDTDILANAPAKMIAAGVGDMAAKYISLCEWKIGHIVTGEYYCQNIANIIYSALDKIATNAPGVLKQDPCAIESVMNGLVLGGFGMNYAQVTRPASGVEHYYSHIWDMRSLEFGTPVELHGIQCGVGTLLALKQYERIKNIKPDKQKALNYAKNFDKQAWFEKLKSFIGPRGAQTMIQSVEKDGRYNLEKHKNRLEVIISRWDDILAEINKLPSYEYVENLIKTVGAPTTPEQLGHSKETTDMCFMAAKDIRNKYIAPMLMWDLGEL